MWSLITHTNTFPINSKCVSMLVLINYYCAFFFYIFPFDERIPILLKLICWNFLSIHYYSLTSFAGDETIRYTGISRIHVCISSIVRSTYEQFHSSDWQKLFSNNEKKHSRNPINVCRVSQHVVLLKQRIRSQSALMNRMKSATLINELATCTRVNQYFIRESENQRIRYNLCGVGSCIAVFVSV